MYYRPAGMLGPRQAARDVSRGGLRVLTDDELAVGRRLEIELFLPDGGSLTVHVRVAWVQEWAGGDAGFEAGLAFLGMDAVQVARLERCLAEHEL